MTRCVVAILGAVLLAGCGDGGPGEEPTAPDTEVAEDDAETTIEAGSAVIGDFLVDQNGRTLYAFLPDDQGEPTCTGECTENWPVVPAPASAGERVDGDLVGSVEHPDAGPQATYNDWPLYHFAGDPVPGDANGQGINSEWFVLNPDGEPITEGGEEETETEASPRPSPGRT